MNPPASKSLNPFRVLATHRNFRLFWIGQTLSLVGGWMQGMAEGWLALELTNDPLLVALIPVATSIPILLFSLPGGVLVDRSNKHRLVLGAQAALLAQATLLWLVTWTGHITIESLLGFAFVAGLIVAVEIPARQSLMIDLVGRDDLRDAIALNSSGFNLARIVGPAFAAAIVASLGIAWCFFVNAVSFLAVLIGLVLMRLPPWTKPAGPTRSPTEGIREILRYLRADRSMRLLVEIVTTVSVLGFPFLALMPVLARERLGLGAGGYGVMLSMVGVGGLTGALALAALGHRVRRGTTLAVSTVAFAILLVVLSVCRIPLAAYVVLFAAGFAMIISNATANALLQVLSPDQFRGRLMAVYSIMVVGMPQVLGASVAGLLARAVGAHWTVAGGAVLMLGYCAYIQWRHPELRAL